MSVDEPKVSIAWYKFHLLLAVLMLEFAIVCWMFFSKVNDNHKMVYVYLILGVY